MANKSITSGQQREIRGFMEELVDNVVREFGLDRESAQKLIGSAGEFKASLREPLVAAIRRLSLSNQFASEEVKSSWCYPPEYKGPKPIGEQMMVLANAFGLSPDTCKVVFVGNQLGGIELPDGAEGWFAIPSIDALAKRHFPNIKDTAEKYCRATELVIENLAATRTVHNYCLGELGTKYLRQHQRTISAFRKIAEAQKGDILIVPAQFGMRHRGRSVYRAREVYSSNEFGLGGFHVGCMALTHPERFVRWEQLHADCPGDEYDLTAESEWTSAPIWRFNDARLKFDTRRFSGPSEVCGSASAFLPE